MADILKNTETGGIIIICCSGVGEPMLGKASLIQELLREGKYEIANDLKDDELISAEIEKVVEKFNTTDEPIISSYVEIPEYYDFNEQHSKKGKKRKNWDRRIF